MAPGCWPRWNGNAQASGLTSPAAALKLLGTPYGFVDIAALGLADLGLRQRWLGRVVDRASTR